MNKKSIKSMCIALAGAVTMSSCIGSFALWNNLKSWNQDATGNKFVNEVIFLAFHIVPVYEICYLADILVFNTMEFWTDENPIAKNVGKTRNMVGSDGRMYAVTNLKNGYEIKDAEGNTMEFTYDKKHHTWSVETAEGKVKLLKMKDDTTAEVYMPDGTSRQVTLNAQGVYALRMAIQGGQFFAVR